MRQDVINTLEVFRYACIHPSQNVNWDREAVKRIEETLLSHPKLERLHALIYQNAIARKQLDWFSAACQNKLKLSTYSLIADIGAKKSQISQLAQVLNDHNLNVLLLKGLAFNSYIYSDNSPRGSSDIDILIKPQDKSRFCELLQQMATVVEQKAADAFGGLFEETWIANNSNSVYFDLHWYLSYPSLYRFDGQAIEKRSIQHPFYQSENIRLLSNEDHIVYLAAHLVKDCDFFHYGLIDCHELICQQKPDLDKCFSIAEQWGIKTGLYYLLMQCKKNLHTPIPESVLVANKPNFIRDHLCLFAINKVFTKPSLLKTAFHRFQQLLAVFLFCDSVGRGLRHNLIFLKRSLIR
jgi:hypothetical protein